MELQRHHCSSAGDHFSVQSHQRQHKMLSIYDSQGYAGSGGIRMCLPVSHLEMCACDLLPTPNSPGENKTKRRLYYQANRELTASPHVGATDTTPESYASPPPSIWHQCSKNKMNANETNMGREKESNTNCTLTVKQKRWAEMSSSKNCFSGHKERKRQPWKGKAAGQRQDRAVTGSQEW